MSYESPRRRSSIATTQGPFPIHQRAHHATNLHYYGNRPGVAVAQSVPTGGVPVLSRKMVARRISEGESGRLKEELKCEACGKGYKHISSLAKHLWEHTPEWNVTSKLLISKHQQVQLLEAASILVSMNEGDEDELEPLPQLQPLGSLAAQQQREREQQQQREREQQQHQIAQNQLQQLQLQQQQQHQRSEPNLMHLHSPGSYTLSPSPGPSGPGGYGTPTHMHSAVFAQSPAGVQGNQVSSGANGANGAANMGNQGNQNGVNAFSPAPSSFSTFTPTPNGRRNSLQFGMSTVAEDEDDFGSSKSPRASAPLPPRFSSSLYGSSVKEEDRERMEEVPSPTKSASSPEKYGDEKDDDDGVFGEMD